MTRELELLDAVEHRALRFREPARELPHFVQVVAAEFAAAAVSCPILLTKNADTGQFYAGAMYGFKPGEQLFGGPGDISPYRPLDLERQGFFVSGDKIAIDREHPVFNEAVGEPLFDLDGMPGKRLHYIQRVLGRLKAGIEETDSFIRVLLQHRLIEPVDISLRFDDGETLDLHGLYSVSLDGLNALDDATALALFRAGHLQLAYCMIGSLKQVAVLAQRRNQRLAAGA
jgi:hypothetical protein